MLTNKKAPYKEANHDALANIQGKTKIAKINDNCKSIAPEFRELINPQVLKDHVSELTTPKIINHDNVLNKLLDEFEVLNFKDIAFEQSSDLKTKLDKYEKDSPEYEEISKQLRGLKLITRHYLVICIDEVLNKAKGNKWGLCKKHDFVYLFNGAYWSELDKEILQMFLGNSAERMGIDRFNSQHYDFKEKLFKQFNSSAYLPQPQQNKDAVLINLQNGTFEININGKNQLKPFNQSYFLTYQLPFEYNSESEAPLFNAYLNKVLPDEATQKVLAEYIGYLFIKNGTNQLKEEKALILYGSGANGKSVFFEIINALLGADNISTYSLESLTDTSGYYRAKIANKLVNYASEINGKLEASLFKQLVSGEPVEARLPYGQPFSLREYAKLIFNCNELPKDVEQTHAFFRRFLIIPFNVTIPPHEQDKELHLKIIQSELSGVFNWVLAGLERLLSQKGFTYSEASAKALDNYKLQSNSIQLFLEDRGYERCTTNFQNLGCLYEEYKNFCLSDGMKAFKKSNFNIQLEALGFVKGRQGGTGQNIIYIKNVIDSEKENVF